MRVMKMFYFTQHKVYGQTGAVECYSLCSRIVVMLVFKFEFTTRNMEQRE
jgi:hypothetical protein